MSSRTRFGSRTSSSGVTGVVGTRLAPAWLFVRRFPAAGEGFCGVRTPAPTAFAVSDLGRFWGAVLFAAAAPARFCAPPAPTSASSTARLPMVGQFCSWKDTELFHINARPQPGREHAYGFSPVCLREWTLRFAFLLKTRWHVGHGKTFSPSGAATTSAAAPAPMATRSWRGTGDESLAVHSCRRPASQFV